MAAQTIPSYDQLVSDPELWDMPRIGTELGVQYQTVKSWRKESIAGRGTPANPHPNLLPTPEQVLSGKPMWKAGTVRLWAMQTGRMSPDGKPQRSKPRGRPRTKAAA